MSASSLELALATFREPARLGELRDRPLPEVLDVIKAAAGESATIEAAAEQLDAPADTIREAAVFFLQQLLFAPNSDAYRVLGVGSDATQDRLRENYRWLMKWLHPDRNQDGWEVVYADRVNAAWQDLKTPDRRAEYDKRTAASPAPAPVGFAPRPVAIRAQKSASPILSGSTVRRLPAMILGGLAALAVATLGLMYWVQVDNERELARAAPSAVSNASNAATEFTDDIGSESMALSDNSLLADTEARAATDTTTAQFTAPSSAASDPQAAGRGDEVESSAMPSPPAAAVAAADTRDPIDAGSVSTSEPVPEPMVAVAPVAPASSVALAEPVAPVAVEPTDLTVARVAIDIGAERASDMSPEPTLAVSNIAPPTVAKPLAPPEPAPLPRPDRTPRPTAPAVVARVQPPEPAPVELSSATVVVPAAPAPAPAPATSIVPPAVVPPPPAAPAPSAASVQSTLREFASAYSAGNRQRFDRLFAAGAADAAPLRAMRERMAGAEMRFLEIGTIDVDMRSDQAVASASFRDTYVPNGQKKAITESGRMRVSLASQGAATLIIDFSR